MSLDLYFKPKIEQQNQLIKNKATNGTTIEVSKKDDDVEIYANYFIKKKLFDKMYDHQKEGVKWLFSLHHQEKGGVLADDMGLGKTLQTIALLSSLFRYNRIKHVLIVAPTTLLINWRKEFKRWSDLEMLIYTIDGSIVSNKRVQIIDKVQASKGILMLTYDLARNLKEELSNHFNREFKWDYLILDEAHKIKNQGKTTKEINMIPSRLRVAITGTPVQNNLSELWSIFNFAMQGSLLGTYATFKRMYETPITLARQKDASTRQKVLGNKIAKSLRKIYEPYLLRRTKEEIFGSKKKNELTVDGDVNSKTSMPPKYDWCIWIKMNQTQIKLYKDFLNSDEVKKILARPDTVKSPLVQLNVLKKICDHPRLLSENTFEQLIYNEEEDLAQLNCIDVPVELLLNESSKLSALNELVKILIAENHKILLFSSSTKMLDIIEKVLKMNKIMFTRLDGRITSNEKREQIVKRFRRESSLQLMLLTVQVGGVGLTLTEADRVIIYNCSWNPGTDSQAIDRAYRIGQRSKNVIVYRFMTSTSVEEKIYSRQVFKDSLTKQTIGKENDPTRYFTSMDLFELFKIGDFTKSKVCDQFNEMHGTLEDKLMKNLRYSDDLSEEQKSVLSHKEKIKNQINEIYNISSHDLLFSKSDETLNTSGIDFAYLNDEVKTAKEMLLKENLLMNGTGNRTNLVNQIQSAKQKLLTQKFGTEFLPLGHNFNQYRESREKFEFNRPKPKAPVKIISLDDDDDEVQFVDRTNNRLLSSLLNKQQSTPKVAINSSDTSKSLSVHSNVSNINSSSSLKSLMTNNTVSSSSSSLRSIQTNNSEHTAAISSNLTNMATNNQSVNNATENSLPRITITNVAPSPVKLIQNDPDLIELSFISKTNSSLMSVDGGDENSSLNDLFLSFDSSMRIDSTDSRKKKNDSSVICLD